MKYILAFTVALLFALPVKADGGFKEGQVFGQKFFCFSEPVMMEYVEYAAEDIQKAFSFFQVSAQVGQCGMLSKPIPVIVKDVLMDYIDSDGDKMQVVKVNLPEQLQHLQHGRELFTIVKESLSKGAKTDPNSSNI